jgi:hypothetical protein
MESTFSKFPNVLDFGILPACDYEYKFPMEFLLQMSYPLCALLNSLEKGGSLYH